MAFQKFRGRKFGGSPSNIERFEGSRSYLETFRGSRSKYPN